MTNMLCDALLAPHAGQQTPFLQLDDGSVWTHAAFLACAARVAGALTEAGVRPGDRVLVQAPKTALTVALYAGCLQAGAIYLPLNMAYTREEVAYFVADAAPALIVCDAAGSEQIADLAGVVPVLTLDADGAGTLAAAMANQPDRFDAVPRGPDDLAALLYTSGTTGRSKGAMMSHRNLLSNARSLTDLWRITQEDRLIHALPIFHTHGLFVALNTALLAGCRVDLMARFSVDQVLAALPHATLMMGVPTFYTRLLAEPGFDRAAVAGMRLFISGSAPLLADTHRDFAARTGHRILERYGMTETNMIASNPCEGERVAGTVGFALPGVEVRIAGTDGAELARGETGMIEVRGQNVFKGYWNMPDKTAEDLRDSGFFITGDLGVMDADGRVSIVGRATDMIITGGYNVYPKEVEDVLNAQPGVVESAVFGVPDADFGEAVMAAVVLEPGASAEALAGGVAAQLARFKHPRRYQVLTELPRNTMGKVQKNVLRQTCGDV